MDINPVDIDLKPSSSDCNNPRTSLLTEVTDVHGLIVYIDPDNGIKYCFEPDEIDYLLESHTNPFNRKPFDQSFLDKLMVLKRTIVKVEVPTPSTPFEIVYTPNMNLKPLIRQQTEELEGLFRQHLPTSSGAMYTQFNTFAFDLQPIDYFNYLTHFSSSTQLYGIPITGDNTFDRDRYALETMKLIKNRMLYNPHAGGDISHSMDDFLLWKKLGLSIQDFEKHLMDTESRESYFYPKESTVHCLYPQKLNYITTLEFDKARDCLAYEEYNINYGNVFLATLHKIISTDIAHNRDYIPDIKTVFQGVSFILTYPIIQSLYEDGLQHIIGTLVSLPKVIIHPDVGDYLDSVFSVDVDQALSEASLTTNDLIKISTTTRLDAGIVLSILNHLHTHDVDINRLVVILHQQRGFHTEDLDPFIVDLMAEFFEDEVLQEVFNHTDIAGQLSMLNVIVDVMVNDGSVHHLDYITTFFEDNVDKIKSIANNGDQYPDIAETIASIILGVNELDIQTALSIIDGLPTGYIETLSEYIDERGVDTGLVFDYDTLHNVSIPDIYTYIQENDIVNPVLGISKIGDDYTISVYDQYNVSDRYNYILTKVELLDFIRESIPEASMNEYDFEWVGDKYTRRDFLISVMMALNKYNNSIAQYMATRYTLHIPSGSMHVVNESSEDEDIIQDQIQEVLDYINDEVEMEGIVDDLEDEEYPFL